jgi:hypothetical protein
MTATWGHIMLGLKYYAATIAMLLPVNQITSAQAQSYGYSCLEVQDGINIIHKRNGYCFQIPEWAQRYGNEGCFIYDQSRVPLSSDERTLLAALVRLRSEKGCTF